MKTTELNKKKEEVIEKDEKATNPKDKKVLISEVKKESETQGQQGKDEQNKGNKLDELD